MKNANSQGADRAVGMEIPTGDSHGYGMGMRTVMNPMGLWGYYGDF